MALAALSALRMGGAWVRGRGGAEGAVGRAPAEEGAYRWEPPAAETWRQFRSGEPVAVAAPAGGLSARYRLAGVFLILTDEGRGSGENRCAILDDLQTKEQLLAAEGEWAGAVRVARVERDHVVLSDGEREERLELAAGPGTGGAKAGGGEAAAAAEERKVLETNRFGSRVGETRWEINRQAVMDYYQEMMDNPERLASLFLAMEADRDAEGKVAGYRLNTAVGEKEFYEQVGLRDGDVVRTVNSMRMTSQRRAEFFIGEFVQNRLGAVVIDVERNGEPKKLVYLVK